MANIIDKKIANAKVNQAMDMLKKGGSMVAYENLGTIRSWMKETVNKK